MYRIPPSQQLAELARQLAEQARDGDAVVDLPHTLIRLGARKRIQGLLEAEITERLGRGRYARRAPGQEGARNGYTSRTLRCAEGRLEIDVPQVRDRAGFCQPALWDALQRRTEVLERLVVELYARGLSTRDIEDALAVLTDGEGLLLSRSTVSRITDALHEEFEAFAQRDLSELEVVYLFADAVSESLRRQAGCREGILVTWAILSDGSKVLVHLSLGNTERYQDWLEHFRDLVRRGLKTPLTVTTDGAPGLIQAVEAMWPEAERIRCWVHKMRNVLDKVPEEARPVLKPYLEAIRDAPDDIERGRRLVAEVVERFGREYPSAMRSLQEDLEASLAHLRLPAAHRKHVRTTNLVERSFEEERWRAKVIPRFRSERELLWRASERWQRVQFSEHERKQLERYIAARQREKAKGKEVSAIGTVA